MEAVHLLDLFDFRHIFQIIRNFQGLFGDLPESFRTLGILRGLLELWRSSGVFSEAFRENLGQNSLSIWSTIVDHSENRQRVPDAV